MFWPKAARLSPVLDNNAIANIKNPWRQNQDRNVPEWRDALELLRLSDDLKPAKIMSMFERNYLLKAQEITVEAVEHMLNKTKDFVSPRDKFLRSVLMTTNSLFRLAPWRRTLNSFTQAHWVGPSDSLHPASNKIKNSNSFAKGRFHWLN